jgi:hypothetical protein
MLGARRHVQDKDTRENSSMGQGVRSQRKKVLQGLRLRNDLKVVIERNMDPELGQRRKDETHSVIKHDTTRVLACEFLRSHKR